MDNLFGVQLKPTKKPNIGKTFAPPSGADGAIELDVSAQSVNYAGQTQYQLDLDQIPTNEYELLMTYRQLALQLEIDEAVQEIANEAIIMDERNQSVAVDLSDVELSETIKDKLRDEFNHILNLLDFRNNGWGIFQKWYIDGQLVYDKVFDTNKPKNGLTAVNPIDPLNIKLIREYPKSGKTDLPIYDLDKVVEYFLYSPTPYATSGSTGFALNDNVKGQRIPRERVAYVPSGLLSADGKQVLSYLYKAIKPFNDLKMMEDSLVIYRVVRAPERRVFYIDVGNLQKGNAEQHIKGLMNRYRNKVVYDVSSGTVNNRKRFRSMMEDYWLPRREGSNSTEIDTLPGGENLSELGDVEYFRNNKLYGALNVPRSRFASEGTAFNIGRTAEITRDEIKFTKFITRLRRKFSVLFRDLLKTQILLKRIMTDQEWLEIEREIHFDFLEDNYFQELKELEIWNDRFEALTVAENSGAIGKYLSHDTIRRTILRQNDDEIKEEDEKMEEEKDDPKYSEPDDEFGEPEPKPIPKDESKPEPKTEPKPTEEDKEETEDE